MIRIALLLSILAGFLFVSGACHKKPSVPAPVPVPVTNSSSAKEAPSAITPAEAGPESVNAVETAPLSNAAAGRNFFESGQRSFNTGKYQQAARSYEDFLKANPESANRDEAFFYAGLSHLLAGDAGRNARQAEAAFKRLMAEFPNSRYSRQAEWILALQDQIEKLNTDVKERDEKIKRLTEELQKLKAIDMQRRPSRPPE